MGLLASAHGGILPVSQQRRSREGNPMSYAHTGQAVHEIGMSNARFLRECERISCMSNADLLILFFGAGTPGRFTVQMIRWRRNCR